MLRTVLVLLILSSGLIAGIFSRYAALLLYLWFAMFRPVEWMWTDISQFRPSLIVGTLLVLPCLVTGVFPALLHPLGIGSILFLATAAFAQLGAVNQAVGWQWMDYVARLVLVGLLIAPLATTRNRVLVAVGVLSGSFLFHGAKAGLASLIGGGGIYASGLAGAFIDSNAYAVGTAMVLFAFLGVALTVPWRMVRLGMVILPGPLAAMAIISLFSRGGLLALGAGAVTFLVLQRRIVVLVPATIIVAASILYLPQPKGYDERISPLTGESELEDDRSVRSRLHFWATAIAMAEARPFGVGLWNFAEAYDQFDSSDGRFGRRRAVHSSHLQVLAETGLLGFVVYVFLLGWSLRILFRVRRRGADETLPPDDRRFCVNIANGLIASIAAFLVGGATVSMALNDMTWFTFGVVIALDRLYPAARTATANVLISAGTWPASST